MTLFLSSSAKQEDKYAKGPIVKIPGKHYYKMMIIVERIIRRESKIGRSRKKS